MVVGVEVGAVAFRVSGGAVWEEGAFGVVAEVAGRCCPAVAFIISSRVTASTDRGMQVITPQAPKDKTKEKRDDFVMIVAVMLRLFH